MVPAADDDDRRRARAAPSCRAPGRSVAGLASCWRWSRGGGLVGRSAAARGFLSALDEQLLGQAGASLEQLLARQRDQLVAEVKVLADDNRIRATVLAPKFDEATVQDVLEDLRKSSGATLLAVVDPPAR